MQVKLFLYIGLLTLGIILSKMNIFGERVYGSIGKLQTFCLILLLTSMGINLGMNDQIIKSLATIGVRGVIFGITTVVFSIAFVYLVVRIFFRKGKVND